MKRLKCCIIDDYKNCEYQPEFIVDPEKSHIINGDTTLLMLEILNLILFISHRSEIVGGESEVISVCGSLF